MEQILSFYGRSIFRIGQHILQRVTYPPPWKCVYSPLSIIALYMYKQIIWKGDHLNYLLWTRKTLENSIGWIWPWGIMNVVTLLTLKLSSFSHALCELNKTRKDRKWLIRVVQLRTQKHKWSVPRKGPILKQSLPEKPSWNGQQSYLNLFYSIGTSPLILKHSKWQTCVQYA